ncbi:DUF805 domain-containing protein [Arvimicrobium flavum]|uniref:DUF805 domain-containing protein n=1 Tax=Arvimicrobium flavum TaxID=3393320 RepID=UPI00237AEB73|nr:DUF805 domain-containing protein [Mesorhizobium shangrilense]
MPSTSTFIWLFFKPSGRVGRAVYFLASMLIGVIQMFPIYKAIRELIRLGPETFANRSIEELFQLSPEFEYWWSIAGFLTFVMLWPSIALTVKRLHDIGRSALFTVVLFIPIAQLVAFILFCAVPGNPGPNKYGVRADVPQ